MALRCGLSLAQTPRAELSAAIDAKGRITEMIDAAGRRCLEENPKLASYARALLSTDIDSLRFFMLDQTGAWLSVRLFTDHMTGLGTFVCALMRNIAPPYQLTAREMEVLTLLAAGLSNQEIGGRLYVRPRTIGKHVENLFAKLGVSTRTAAAILAIENGLLWLPSPGGVVLTMLAIGRLEQAAAAPSSQPAARTASRRPIIIGAPLSLSGLAADDAHEMLNGTELAVAEINAKGGVLGRELQVLAADCDVAKPDSVIRAHQRLIDAEVDAISAGYCCAQPAVQDLAGDYRAPFLHAATMESVVARVRHDPSRLGNLFQVCPSDVHYGPGLARFLIDLEASGSWRPHGRRLTIVQPTWPGMDVGLAALERLLSARGWRIDLIDGLPLSGVDWSSVVRKVHTGDPAAILLAHYFPEENIAFQRAFAADPARALVYTLYGPSVPSYIETLGAAAEGVLWATTTGLYSDAIGQGFAMRYRKRYGVSPGRSHASIAYDRVHMLANAWARVGNPRSFDKVVADLRTTIHRGANGAYFLGGDGQAALSFPYATQDPSISQAHLVFQIQDGRHRILSPEPYVDGRFRLPSWFSAHN